MSASVSNGPTAAAVACAQGSCNTECFDGQSVCDATQGDTACITCIKGPSATTGCCDELTACSADAECLQCLGCIQSTGDAQGCVVGGDCQLNDPETGALLQCGQQNCQNTCAG